MGYDHNEQDNRAKAAQRLSEMRDLTFNVPVDDERVGLPAREVVDFFPELTGSRVVGVHVYEQDGKWFSDLEFEGVPEGQPTLVCSEPMADVDSASAAATMQLSICVSRERGRHGDPERDVIFFKFDEVDLPVSPALVARYAARNRVGPSSTRDSIHSWLAELRYGISGAGASFTDQDWGACDKEVKIDVLRAATAAMAIDIRSFSREDAVWYAEREPSFRQ